MLQSKTPNSEDSSRVEETFYCRAKRRRVALPNCLDGYLNANAFAQRRRACWRCPQGRKIREDFANS